MPGQASVRYNVGDLTGARQVVASIRHESILDVGIWARLTVRPSTSTVTGSTPRPPSEPSQPAAGTDTITITLSETTGAPGDEIDVTVDSDLRVLWL